ncbi:MAG TPA: hypothetical protein VGO57_07935 [Verrucomicrobiae bacterium]
MTVPTVPSVRFALATEKNDAAIRQLLRENPTRGRISLSFEHEPDYFRSTQMPGTASQTIVGFLHGKLIGVGRCTFRQCHLNGQVRRVGYLSELRLAASVQGRFDILRRGYQFFRELHRADPADFYFTSIAADNERSLRFLERNLPGMPAYKFAADFVTLVIPVARRRHRQKTGLTSAGLKFMAGNDARLTQLVSFLNLQAVQNQLAAFWTGDDLLALKDFGLALPDFQLILDGNDSIVAGAALWDQRSFKQNVVRDYAAKISMVRPLINLSAKLLGTVHLPSVGSTLNIGFISPLSANDLQSALALIESLLSQAAGRGLEFLTLGLAENDARLTAVRRQFHAREYKTRLYQVMWDKSEAAVLDDRPFLPEVAFL